ncbi:beta-lactamase [Vibrio tubiashii]|nr:beta-lactamase [Vibrio tubiashii]
MRVLIILFLLVTVAVFAISGCSFIHQTRFGADPEGDRLDSIRQSANYSEGTFHNIEPTPLLKDGESKLSIIFSNMRESVENLHPKAPIPANKMSLKSLPMEQDFVIWLGHSSFYVQLSGKRILIDPVLSPYASPVSFMIKAFDGTTVYSVDDFPYIDTLLISHDHWDHLDYDTVTALQAQVDQIFVPLGVGAHFEAWGFEDEQIHEADWFDKLHLDENVTLHLVPSRHYSGRGLGNSKTLWGGFVLESNQRRLLFGGDSGYGAHFKTIGERFGSFDLVALDMGQYDPRWPYIHMTPEQASQAAIDLNAKALLPSHIGRFTLARHDWREPFRKITELSTDAPYQLVTPIIGDTTKLTALEESSSVWWEVE